MLCFFYQPLLSSKHTICCADLLFSFQSVFGQGDKIFPRAGILTDTQTMAHSRYSVILGSTTNHWTEFSAEACEASTVTAHVLQTKKAAERQDNPVSHLHMLMQISFYLKAEERNQWPLEVPSTPNIRVHVIYPRASMPPWPEKMCSVFSQR